MTLFTGHGKAKYSFPTSCRQSYPQLHKTASYTTFPQCWLRRNPTHPFIHSIFLSKKFNKKSPALYRKLLSAKKAHGLQFTVPCAFTLLFRYLIVLLLLCQLHNLKLKLLSDYNKKVPAVHQLPLPPQSLRGYCFPATFIA